MAKKQFDALPSEIRKAFQHDTLGFRERFLAYTDCTFKGMRYVVIFSENCSINYLLRVVLATDDDYWVEALVNQTEPIEMAGLDTQYSQAGGTWWRYYNYPMAWSPLIQEMVAVMVAAYDGSRRSSFRDVMGKMANGAEIVEVVGHNPWR